ncbi:sensor histidine kinase, partial [Microbacterium sp.]|uniref:sensor histidine kinase n=1 Tax=Microbacterium sp. TaxID=51671 RepID=UPI0037CAEAF0
VGRIVQEGVTNAMRHAPGATSIDVRLVYAADAVTVEVVNDGATGPIGTSGFGLRGLAERAAHAGGSVVSEPLSGGRWMLRAELPTASPATPAPTDLTIPDPEDRR